MGVAGLTTFIESESGLGITKPVDIGQAASSSPIKDKKVLIIDLPNFSAELFRHSVVPFVLGKMANLKQELRAFLTLLESKNITPIFPVGKIQSRNQGGVFQSTGLLAKCQKNIFKSERRVEEVFGDIERALRNSQNSLPPVRNASISHYSYQIQLCLR